MRGGAGGEIHDVLRLRRRDDEVTREEEERPADRKRFITVIKCNTRVTSLE